MAAGDAAVIKRVTPPGEDRPGEGRMARWSRLKQEARSENDKPPAVAEAEKTAALVPAAPPDGAGDEKNDPLKDLPPIESLGKDSDYSMFMREGVPDDRRAEALQKLWTSDPTFREAFPFEMHMEDYHTTFRPIDALRDTIYKAGRGFLTPEDIVASSGDDAEKTAVAEKTEEETVADRTDATGPGDDAAGALPAPESSSEPLQLPDGQKGQAALAPEQAVNKSDRSD